jgi:hypothetical protein
MQGKCSGTSKRGAPCRAPAPPGSPFCLAHDPARVTDLAAWRRQGGAARSNQARAKRRLPGPLTPAELQSLMGDTLRKVLAGEVEPGVGNCVANLGRAIVAVREATEHDERIAALEAAAGLRPRTA